MANEDLSNFINQAKQSTKKQPIQKVTPVKGMKQKKEKPPEVQVAFFLEKNLYKKMKTKALDMDCTYKQIIHEALDQYLTENN